MTFRSDTRFYHHNRLLLDQGPSNIRRGDSRLDINQDNATYSQPTNQPESYTTLARKEEKNTKQRIDHLSPYSHIPSSPKDQKTPKIQDPNIKMRDRTDPFNYHFDRNARRRNVYPSSPPPGSPPNEFRDDFERPMYDPDSMLASASMGDFAGGQYYTWSPPSPAPRQPRARRSRPFGSSASDWTLLQTHEARLQARDWRRRDSYGRETVVEETEVDDDDDGDEGGRLRLTRTWARCGSGDGSRRRRRGDEDDDEEASLAVLEREPGQYETLRSQVAEAVRGSVGGGDQQQKDPRKRRPSVQAIIDIGKGLKKRADSLVLRKDSGAELQEVLPQVSGEYEFKFHRHG